MFESEAKWIARQLSAIDSDAINPVVDIGSSTELFRKHYQPHIDREIFNPLRDRGIQIIHVDAKAGDGVDISGDITDSAVQDAIRKCAPKLVICANFLEHTADRPAVVNILRDIVGPEGFLLLTAPRSYPYHADPIDTGYRPTPDELASLFHEYSPISKAIVHGKTYAEIIREHPRKLLSIPFRLLIPSRGGRRGAETLNCLVGCFDNSLSPQCYCNERRSLPPHDQWRIQTIKAGGKPLGTILNLVRAVRASYI